MNKNSLIIFIKNPELGKAKTRIAATLGPGKALAIYKQLLTRTREITQDLPISLALYYSDFIPAADEWENHLYRKYRQTGFDLGERMQHAFQEQFNLGYNRVCIIGSDCYELTSEIILLAFKKLEIHDVVIGPAEDGGYYLLGLNEWQTFLFEGKTWSTDSVLQETLGDIKEKGITVSLLPTLTDVDEEKDLTVVGLEF